MIRLDRLAFRMRLIVLVCTLGYALMLCMLASDVSADQPMLLASIVHATPALLVAIGALLGWKRPHIGCLWFCLVTIGFFLFFDPGSDFVSIMIVNGLPLLLSASHAILWAVSRRINTKR